ncbi:DUF551 domain-containing protein [Acinetobacter baumannii]|nr:DUF551 domain-containing protein [Acinetobacter baumannii]MBJ9389325.1 DUF551 domain-containing protein [Acinetobacter baumannii]MBJ9433197.1 DUF551 domain-containing protein [Acinetobacter baumannii]OTU72792.1 hypothetical protein CAT30_15770 [Acinetobacter baumannii]OVL07041.1 hypothetical protein B4R90_16605 [Acinetobacter baumannii]
MLDLNKEREAFLNTFQYYKGRRDIIFSHEHELFMTRSNNPSEVAQKEISNMNSRWDAWLRCAKHRDAELEKAKAQAVPEWISVKDGLPSYEESVLIKTNKGTVQGYLFQDEEYSEMEGEYIKLDCWQDEFHDDLIEYSDVTHWMPLPTALSESGAEG